MTAILSIGRWMTGQTIWERGTSWVNFIAVSTAHVIENSTGYLRENGSMTDRHLMATKNMAAQVLYRNKEELQPNHPCGKNVLLQNYSGGVKSN